MSVGINKLKFAEALATTAACMGMMEELRERLEKAAADMAGEVEFGLDRTATGADDLRAAVECAQAFVEQLDINLGFAPRCDLAMAALLSYTPNQDRQPRQLTPERQPAQKLPVRGLMARILS